MTRLFEDIKNKEDRYHWAPTRSSSLYRAGRGVYVYDSGAAVLDLYGGHAVAITGTATEGGAAVKPGEKLIFYSNVVYSSVRAEPPSDVRPPPAASTVFFCNSGPRQRDGDEDRPQVPGKNGSSR